MDDLREAIDACPHCGNHGGTYFTAGHRVSCICQDPSTNENADEVEERRKGVELWNKRAMPAPMSVAEALSPNDIYYLKAIQRRLDEFRDALDGIEGLSIGGEAFADERDWLDTFIDAKSRALASSEGE